MPCFRFRYFKTDSFFQGVFIGNSRVSSAEELFFSLTRKMSYKNRASTLHTLRGNLILMNQASMKYKLGKLTRVSLDTLSFTYFSSKFRGHILLNYSKPGADYSTPDREGWSDLFLDSPSVSYDAENQEASLESLIHYIFETVVSRKANVAELRMFKDYMLNDNGEIIRTETPRFTLFNSDGEIRLYDRKVLSLIILDYVSRLADMYMQKKVD